MHSSYGAGPSSPLKNAGEKGVGQQQLVWELRLAETNIQPFGRPWDSR